MEETSNPPNPPANQNSGAEIFHEKVREKLLEYLAMALPIALINGLVVWIMQRFFSQPWQVLWFVIPLVALGYGAWRIVSAKNKLKLGRPLVILFAIYTLVFCLAAGTELLNWKRSLAGYEEAVPRNFLAMNWAGDWRYLLARQLPANRDLAIVMMKPAESIDASRYNLARLIKLAVANGAKGIAFDFYLNQDASNKQTDDLLCAEVTNAESKQVPVLVGYGFHLTDNEPNRDLVAPHLTSCLPLAKQGHLIGYSEFDGKVRLVPLYFRGDQELSSLNLKVGKFLKPDLQMPGDGLLQFVKPQTLFPKIYYEDLFYTSDEQKKRNEWAKLRDRFVLVGEESQADSFETPYGQLPGVVIHSFVIHSLRTNTFIRRVPWWSSFLMVFVSCYLVTLLFAQNWSFAKMTIALVVISLIIVSAAALAMWFWLVWVDAIYALTSVWLLFGLLALLRRVFNQRLITG